MIQPTRVIQHGDATIYDYTFGAVLVHGGVVIGVCSGAEAAKREYDTLFNRIEHLEHLNITDADGLCLYCIEAEPEPGHDLCAACRTSTEVMRTLANATIARITEQFMDYRNGDEPLLMDQGFDGRDWTIVWEEGPDDWPFLLSQRLLPSGVRVEPVNHYSVGVYPS